MAMHWIYLVGFSETEAEAAHYLGYNISNASAQIRVPITCRTKYELLLGW